MFAQRNFFNLAIVFSALASVAFGQRDTSFPACDNGPNDHKMTKYGTSYGWFTSDDPVAYVASGKGACGQVYTDQSNVVCLAPGHVNSANVNGCNKWVQIRNDANGATTQARVLDACGALPNTTFGCNDLFLSKRAFEQLAGNQRQAALAAGHLEGNVTWNFITESCWGCYAGFPGKLLDGSTDPCTGQDSAGFLRCGRKGGAQRIVGAESAEVCNIDIQTCDEANTIAKGIYARHSTTSKRSAVVKRDV
ncbi:uncharacterized protein FA14DRAFT_185177 [Meira miltonrushii]|uniref:Cyanovirin-N domain-containing protein n=1 Tax=Meira miltonrushii TaxID=1280837 RepID=A0A316VB18_9BASI|nr:uncharacterized protein FA14DRAFT_185177 [Meira miltonrushii]PWN33403.1 hypothetical protein FA14DRAFT_185177 [Meira miltonrushii]